MPTPPPATVPPIEPLPATDFAGIAALLALILGRVWTQRFAPGSPTATRVEARVRALTGECGDGLTSRRVLSENLHRRLGEATDRLIRGTGEVVAEWLALGAALEELGG